MTRARHTYRRRAAIAGAGLWMSALLLAAGCTRTEWVYPPSKENSAKIAGTEHGVAQMSYSEETIEYPVFSGELISPGPSEQGVTVHVKLLNRAIADTARPDVYPDVTATIPARLLGREIDLASRDARPDTEGLYYTFHLSQRGGGLYCRVLSWITDPDEEPHDSYGGTFKVSRGTEDDEYLFEWKLTDLADGQTVSEGYVGGVFARIPKQAR